MSRDFNPDLYLVTDRNLSRGRPVREIVEAAVRGGVTMVQLREKDSSAREFVESARQLKRLLSPAGVPLIINDRVDVALAAGADGVHIGQEDIPFEAAREILGPEKIIGLSVESAEDALEADRLDVDYLGISPVFLTQTKTELTRELGLEGVRKIKSVTSHLLVGIGGLNASNLADVILAGADGVAVVSALCSADDPEEAALELSQAIRMSKKERQNETF
ncbi:MAG: thiamine phosphate synthase [Candidatus Latescibacteria bacterium]|nr:thiamine phosphate synthase [bacterium]MBD3424432.1 thiamine phosphate synthase [Candidatus Latescibacterota bacterium]